MFQFWNEFDLLKIQLEENYDFVDKFVITESLFSWTGKRKPLYFKNNKHKFSKYSDKIIHLIADIEHVKEFPPEAIMNIFPYDHIKENWVREYFARRLPFDVIDIKPDDIIYDTDADMIIDIKTIKNKIDINKYNKFQIQELFYYFNNDLGKNYLPICFQMKKFPQIPICWYPFHSERILNIPPENINYIDNAAWHFSCMGGLDRCLMKMDFSGHSDTYGTNEHKSVLIDMYENKKFNLKKPEDLNLPKYVVDHMDEFKEYFLEI